MVHTSCSESHSQINPRRRREATVGILGTKPTTSRLQINNKSFVGHQTNKTFSAACTYKWHIDALAQFRGVNAMFKGQSAGLSCCLLRKPKKSFTLLWVEFPPRVIETFAG